MHSAFILSVRQNPYVTFILSDSLFLQGNRMDTALRPVVLFAIIGFLAKVIGAVNGPSQKAPSEAAGTGFADPD